MERLWHSFPLVTGRLPCCISQSLNPVAQLALLLSMRTDTLQQTAWLMQP